MVGPVSAETVSSPSSSEVMNLFEQGTAQPRPAAKPGKVIDGKGAPTQSDTFVKTERREELKKNNHDLNHFYSSAGIQKKVYKNGSGNKVYYDKLRKDLIAKTQEVETWIGVTGDMKPKLCLSYKSFDNKMLNKGPFTKKPTFQERPGVDFALCKNLFAGNYFLSLSKLRAESNVSNKEFVDADPWSTGVEDAGATSYQTNAIINVDSAAEFARLVQKNARAPTDIILTTHGEPEMLLFQNSATPLTSLSSAEFKKTMESLFGKRQPGSRLFLRGCFIAQTEEAKNILQYYADYYGIEIVANTEVTYADNPLSGNPISFFPDPVVHKKALGQQNARTSASGSAGPGKRTGKGNAPSTKQPAATGEVEFSQHGKPNKRMNDAIYALGYKYRSVIYDRLEKQAGAFYTLVRSTAEVAALRNTGQFAAAAKLLYDLALQLK